METLSAIMRGDLPPVGNPITLTSRNHTAIEIPGYHFTWVNSGTSALALALLAARKLKAHIREPEVIIPAYGCPDLVAACAFAKCKAKLVDIGREGWGYDLKELRQALSANTLAVIGVTFLGIREDWPAINSILSAYTDVVTIEDNAQWFPNLEEQNTFFTDFIVFSFGKGKPVSLLGGGALLSRIPLANIDAHLAPTQNDGQSTCALRAKFLLYNQLLKPSVYWFLNHNPIFTPGNTQYRALDSIRALDRLRLDLLSANYVIYTRRKESAVNEYNEQFARLNINCTIFFTDKSRIKRLLRYPFLCADRTARDKLLQRLNQNGLGATAMYRRPLVRLDCPPNFVDSALRQNNAASFADRLITLPCHLGVTSKHIRKITQLIAEEMQLSKR
ncbi:MAG TPA: DegT/DnrJ/EryC1/StrS family aminotransferase [Cellvibrionaceae bacterium]